MHLPLCTTAVKENNTPISLDPAPTPLPGRFAAHREGGSSQACWSWYFLYGEAKSLFPLTAAQGRTVFLGFDVLIMVFLPFWPR